jgi:hypothetical protein
LEWYLQLLDVLTELVVDLFTLLSLAKASISIQL